MLVRTGDNADLRTLSSAFVLTLKTKISVVDIYFVYTFVYNTVRLTAGEGARPSPHHTIKSGTTINEHVAGAKYVTQHSTLQYTMAP